MNDKFKDTPVIVIQEAKQDAYDMGYERFEGGDTMEPDEADLAPYHSSADYANNVLPTLRSMAGHADSGHGTYTEVREVVLVEEHDLDDRPIMGQSTDAHYFMSELVEAFNHGAYDALTGEGKAEVIA